MELTPQAAAVLPPRVRQLCGFQMHRDLGFFSNEVHATDADGDAGDDETKEWLQEWREAAAATATKSSATKVGAKL